MAPVCVRGVPLLAYPLDGGRSWRGRALLGPNKTVRGMVFGTLAGVATSMLLSAIVPTLYTETFSILANVPAWGIGFLLGSGALCGDALKSFFKRQSDIASGAPWWGFDQTDWILGAFLFLAPVALFEPAVYVVGVVCGGLAHPLVNIGAYLTGVRSEMY